MKTVKDVRFLRVGQQRRLWSDLGGLIRAFGFFVGREIERGDFRFLQNLRWRVRRLHLSGTLSAVPRGPPVTIMRATVASLGSPPAPFLHGRFMTDTSAAPRRASAAMIWTGYVISTLPVLMLAMSATMKFLQPKEMVEGMAQMGWPMSLALPLGIVETVCTLCYIIPQTAVLGAILLTGYLGGAIATHVRVEDGNFFMPLLIGVALWLGLFLRDPRLRALLPWRKI